MWGRLKIRVIMTRLNLLNKQLQKKRREAALKYQRVLQCGH